VRGGACGAVLLWWDGEDANALRRLQLAAESGQALAVLFRPESAAQRLSPAALRLRIDDDGSFGIVKCRGGDWRAERGSKLRLQKRGQSTFSPSTEEVSAAGLPAAKMYSDPLFAPLRALPSRAVAGPVQPGLAIGADAEPAADWRAQARRERQRRS
jgi:hypothetical protein